MSQKLAKKEAADIGLVELKKYYYSIKVKKALNPEAEGVMSDKMREDTFIEKCLSDDNIGRKMMKLMGWTGGGLGKSSQGITEPVT